MAIPITVYNDGYTLGGVNQGAHTNAVTLLASWTTPSLPLGGMTVSERPRILSPVLDEVTLPDFGPTNSGRAYSGAHTVAADTTQLSKPRVFRYATGNENYPQGFYVGPDVQFKSAAVTAVASTPTASGITSSGASIECDFFPNTAESTVTAQLQYRIFGSGAAWAPATTAGYATSGYAETTAAATLSGLAGSTTYEVRLVVTRTTVNETTLTSASGIFVTAANAPVVTTGDASSVGATAATLNATLTANGISTTLHFEYGLTAAYGSSAAATPSSSASDTALSANISGLSQATLYHFRAKGVHAGGQVLGSDATFTTAADPAAVAADEDHLLLWPFDAVYGVAKSFVFCAASPAAISRDKFFTGAAPWSAAECQITKDGGAAASVTNVPVRIGNSAFYSITLTAAELSAENIFVHISDSGDAVRDVVLHIRTKLELGQVSVNATQFGGNVSGMNLTGVGTSPGLNAIGGSTSPGDIFGVFRDHVLTRGTAQAGGASTITLDTSAVASDDFYNGALVALVGSTGSGQFRAITDYVGATKVATVNRPWTTNPSATTEYIVVPGHEVWDIPLSGELSALPGATSTYGKFLQFLFQRIAYKRTKTADTFTMLKANSSTALATGALSNDGSTEEAGKLS